MGLPNTNAAADDLADLAGTFVGTLESGKGLVSEVSSLISNTNIRSDIAGLMVSLPASATELIGAAKGGVLTIAIDAPEIIGDAMKFYTKLIAAIAAAKGVSVIITTTEAK